MDGFTGIFVRCSRFYYFQLEFYKFIVFLCFVFSIFVVLDLVRSSKALFFSFNNGELSLLNLEFNFRFLGFCFCWVCSNGSLGSF